MKEEERDKLLEIRLRSKRGGELTNDDIAFLSEMFREFPKEYSLMSTEVFNITAAGIGSHKTIKE